MPLIPPAAAAAVTALAATVAARRTIESKFICTIKIFGTNSTKLEPK